MTALVPALAIYGLFTLWPLLQVFVLALERWNGYGPRTFVGLGSVQVLLSDQLFHTSLIHSLVWEIAAILLLPTLGLGLALVMDRARGRALFLTVVFFPALLPATVVAAIWYLVYSPLSGLADALLGLAGLGNIAPDWLGDPHLALGALFAAWLWSAIGVTTLIFWTALQSIGREYIELALVEGAGVLWRFRHVTLPGVRTAALITTLVTAALGLQVFDLIFVTTGGGPGNATMLLPLDTYSRAFGGHVGTGAAEAALQALAGLALGALMLGLGRGGTGLDTGEGGRDSPAHFSLSLTGLAAVALIIILLPMAWLARAAIEPGRAFTLGIGGATLDPRTWDGSNLGAAWNAGMGGALASSLLLALIVVAGTLLLAAPAAYTLAHRAGPVLRGSILVLLVISLFQSPIVTIIPLFSLLGTLGLLDTPWGVILPEIARGLPFAILVLWGFLSQLPSEPLEAAWIDGASVWQHMTRITLPLARPAIWAVAIWSFITSWNEYVLPTVVSRNGTLQTVPTLLATFIGRYDTALGALAAGSLLASLPSLAIYLALRRTAGSGLRRAGESL